eukprot:NODE_873_length_2022_cov_46.830964_g826_i0.p1 GENE.NODE_873_length_2022_cov_46.830964_g826_i0~~NODE_873_length_2022_cov_46.830964_g826_i0.p1  ORF type:complete len:609 (-),score=119.32 NODE_873_length_2022_cov_46.830964_g826_i0:71-1897(-)
MSQRNPNYSRFRNEFLPLAELPSSCVSHIICKARSLVDGTYYCVERFDLTDPRDHMRSTKEAAILASLCNPHIVRYFSCWLEQHFMFMQTELWEGAVSTLHAARWDNYHVAMRKRMRTQHAVERAKAALEQRRSSSKGKGDGGTKEEALGTSQESAHSPSKVRFSSPPGSGRRGRGEEESSEEDDNRQDGPEEEEEDSEEMEHHPLAIPFKVDTGQLWAESELLLLVQHVSQALQTMHAQDLGHNNVVPSSIFVACKRAHKSVDVVYKLGRMGDAVDIEGAPKEMGATPPQNDVLGLGATVFQLAVGKPLPKEARYIGGKWLDAIAQQDYNIRNHFSTRFVHLLRTMLHEDGAQRPSLADILEDATKMREGRPGSAKNEASPRTRPSHPRVWGGGDGGSTRRAKVQAARVAKFAKPPPQRRPQDAPRPTKQDVSSKSHVAHDGASNAVPVYVPVTVASLLTPERPAAVDPKRRARPPREYPSVHSACKPVPPPPALASQEIQRGPRCKFVRRAPASSRKQPCKESPRTMVPRMGNWEKGTLHSSISAQKMKMVRYLKCDGSAFSLSKNSKIRRHQPPHPAEMDLEDTFEDFEEVDADRFSDMHEFGGF